MAAPSTFRACAAIAFFLALVPATPAAEQIDQSNLSEWAGGWTHVNPTADGQAVMWQTFTPACMNLTAVEIDILTISPGRGDDVLIVEIAREGVVLVSAERAVEDGFDGLLRFEFPEAVPLVPEQLYELMVRDTGATRFGWKYGPNTYERGSRYVFAQQQLGYDWFFRTYAWVEAAAAKYSGGTGEPNDPYQIATAADLIALGETPEDYDKHFILTADIDMDPNLPGRKGFDRAVIAPDTNDVESYFQGVSFTGFFDGDGYTISHLTISGISCVGLFGQLGSTGRVSNLGLEAVCVSGTGNWVGGLAGSNGGSIAVSYSTGSVSGTGTDVGGLVGCNWGSIATSYSNASANGDSRVGGLVGDNEGSIAVSYSTGSVSGTGSDVGGLVGIGYLGSVGSSFWDIKTSGQMQSDGGTGETTAQMQDIETLLSAGWDFVGETGNGTCDYWEISSGQYPRLHYHGSNRPFMPEGLGTAQEPYLIQDARDLGTVWFKPLAHYRLVQSIDLSGITWSLAVIPGFDGSFKGDGHVISNLHIKGAGYLGLFGQLSSKARVSNLGLETVQVSGTGWYVGGLAGRSGGNISSSYVGGLVSSPNIVGGLVGHNDHGSIVNCYSAGSVSGFSVGGLVCHNDHGSIVNCYSAGSVRGEFHVGGLVGWNDGSIDSSFWDIQASGPTWSAGGTGKTTAEMQTAGTFLDAGWDFVDEATNGMDDIWWILEGKDYPRLWWEVRP